MLNSALKTHFGHDAFRPGQDEVIQSILNHRDTLALMPTGGGKSLCFQLPAQMLPGITLVISPLIALMKDQVDALRSKGIEATFLNSSLSEGEMAERRRAIREGKFKLVYLAPERLALPAFSQEVTGWPVSLVAVDEAHCVSQWGHDFRPDYLLIKGIIGQFKNRPVVSAFTATATPEVKMDIIDRLGLVNPAVFVRGFDRPNLIFLARPGLKNQERFKETARILKSMSGSAIVYAGKRDTTEELSDYLKSQGIDSRPYHAGMETDQRTAAQEDFMNDRVRVIVATIAFGMGVDKPDVRLVIHAHMPGSLENYYQEAGRAGRDGEKAYCILLHSYQDGLLHSFFIRKSNETMLGNGLSPDEAGRQCKIKEDRLRLMERFVQERTCRRKKILDYFGDPAAATMQNCGKCDICMNYQWKGQESGADESDEDQIKVRVRNLSAEELLFEKLRHRRLSLARRLNVKAFMIFSDRVLKEMAEKRPIDEGEMMAISGVGPKLFELYGNDFLRVIRKHLGLRKNGLPPGGSSRLSATQYQQGKPISEIAKERGLKESTIYEHLCKEHWQSGFPDLSVLLPHDIANEIKTVIEGFKEKPEGLKAIKERCSERVQYHHIRLVLRRMGRMAYVKKAKSEVVVGLGERR